MVHLQCNAFTCLKNTMEPMIRKEMPKSMDRKGMPKSMDRKETRKSMDRED